MAKNNPNMRKGICTNFGNCAKADSHEIQEISLDNEFICQNEDCGQPLEILDGDDRGKNVLKWILIILAALVILSGIGFGVYKYINKGGTVKSEQTWHPITPDKISLDSASLSFQNQGENKQLKATIHPDSIGEKNKEIIWKSGDPTIATVDENGRVTAIANGSVVISAYTGNGLSATCNVTIGNVIDVTKVELDKTLLLNVGDSKLLEKTVNPKNATIKEVFWKSDNEAVAKVDSNGHLTAIAKGTTKITIIVNGEKTATCIVTVDEGGGGSIISVLGGTYKGKCKNGKPEGMVTIYYTTRTVIRESPKQSIAETGEYLVGDFRNGSLLQGILYYKNGEPKEKIIVGGGAY